MLLIRVQKRPVFGQRSHVTAPLKAGILIPILFSMWWHSQTRGYRGREALAHHSSDYSAFSTDVCTRKKVMRVDWVPLRA